VHCSSVFQNSRYLCLTELAPTLSSIIPAAGLVFFTGARQHMDTPKAETTELASVFDSMFLICGS